MPLYSDHYYYGSGQPPPYYLSSSPYTSKPSRISSPYSFSYMSPISAMLSAGIGTNPVPRGLRSYSPMLSAISETGSPLMSRRDIGNHRSSPRHLGSKNYYRQRPVVIDTDNLDLNKKKEDNEEVESTPGMISRAKTIVRMHTRKLKENPELKKKKTQAEILMEKYFIKEKPAKEEDTPKRKRIWEEREEELNNTLVRRGTIKRNNTVHKRVLSPAPLDEIDVPEKPDEIVPLRRMSIDSEMLKEEEALLDCMIQEELGLSNLKEMKVEDRNDDKARDKSIAERRKSDVTIDQMHFGRRKSSVDSIVDESGAPISRRKSHMRKKKNSKPLPLDELNSSEGHSGSDSSSKNNKDETRVCKRRSTKKKKAPKFKIDSLLVEEKSSPKLLKKFQYEVIVEESKKSDNSSVKRKSIKHINKDDIPKNGQQKLLHNDISVKGDSFINITLGEKAFPLSEKLSSNVCDSACDTLANNLTSQNETLTNKSSFNIDCKPKIDKAEKKTSNLTSDKAIKLKSPNNETGINKVLDLDNFKKQKTEPIEQKSPKYKLEKFNHERDNQMETKNEKLGPNEDLKVTAIIPDKKLQIEPSQPEVKVGVFKPKQDTKDATLVVSSHMSEKSNLSTLSTENSVINIKEPLLNDKNLASTIQKVKTDDKHIQIAEKLDTKFATAKQKSLTPDLGRKVITNVTAKSEPNTPIMPKKPLLPKSAQKIKSNETEVGSTATNTMLNPNIKPGETSILDVTDKPQLKNVLDADKRIEAKPTLLKTEAKKIGGNEEKSDKEQIEAKSTLVKTEAKASSEKEAFDSVANKQIKAKSAQIKPEIKASGLKETQPSSLEILSTNNNKQMVNNDQTFNKVLKNENSSDKIISESKNRGLTSFNKAEDSTQSNVKKQINAVTKEASKDEVTQLNIENTKTQFGQKGKIDSGVLTKNNQAAIKLQDNKGGLQNITPTEISPISIERKDDKCTDKNVDCNSNNISKMPTGNEVVAVKKLGLTPQKEENKIKGPVIAIKPEPNKEEVKEIKPLTNIKSGEVEKMGGKVSAIASKTPLENNKTKLTPEGPLKNQQQKCELLKKETAEKAVKNTEIVQTKEATNNEAKNDKTPLTPIKDAIATNKAKIIQTDEKANARKEIINKDKAEILNTGNLKQLPTDIGKNMPKDKIINSKVEPMTVKQDQLKSSTQVVLENREHANKLKEKQKSDDVCKNKTDTSKANSNVEITANSGLDRKKGETTVDNKVKPSEAKQPFNQVKETKIDKSAKVDEAKELETKITKQPKIPTSKPKAQEHLNDTNKTKKDVTESNVVDSNNQKLEKSNKVTEKLNTDQNTNKMENANKKPTTDKEKTIKANKEKKKRIKSESDMLDDECASETKISSKELDCKSTEKSQSLKEISTEKSSKKKKKSHDKDSSKKRKNPKSPRKTKESPKTVDSTGHKVTMLSQSQLKTTSLTSETVTTTKENTTTTTTTVTTEEAEHTSRELSKRSTRLLHFINKCMRLSEDDDSLIIDYSDEDVSSSSSEYTSDSDYTSDSEEDTLTDDSSDECDVNCHRKCEKLMPNLCGVNQKLIVEALSSLRKGSSESRDHGSPTRRHSNAALSLDDESPRHGGGGAGAGRVTPPATTIPKFRKYTMDDFQFLKVLGKGSFGKVLLAELRGTQYYYAVKCLKKDVVLEDDDVECTLIERKVLALGTNHPYLCHLFCTFQTESHLFFVMEYLNGGDLMFHIQQQGRFDEGRARFYAAEIVSGLKFLHKKGIVYRDLKLDNILLDFDGHVRIADFGMCKLQIYLDRTADTFCGTPDYMAPEIIKGLKYNQCVDWWSFGILMYEMLVGQSPFSGCDEDDLFWCICNRQPHYPRFITLEAKRILMQLLEKEASKRLGSCENGALEVMAHPFFNGMDWDRLERRELVPPFKPNVKHPLDVHYFDKHFTAERACLTPIDPSILQSMDQTQFQGFSYTNPNVTD